MDEQKERSRDIGAAKKDWPRMSKKNVLVFILVETPANYSSVSIAHQAYFLCPINDPTPSETNLKRN